jgi:hypothetical protein
LLQHVSTLTVHLQVKIHLCIIHRKIVFKYVLASCHSNGVATRRGRRPSTDFLAGVCSRITRPSIVAFQMPSVVHHTMVGDYIEPYIIYVGLTAVCNCCSVDQNNNGPAHNSRQTQKPNLWRHTELL